MADNLDLILLVEDSPDEAAFFSRIFIKAHLPARLEIVTDGREALDFVFGTGRHAHPSPAAKPKLIVLDLKLPRVDGLEVLRRLKSDLRTRNIPVVVLSSSREEFDLIESYAMGVNSYLVKPVDFDQLVATVRVLGEYWLQFNQTSNQ